MDRKTVPTPQGNLTVEIVPLATAEDVRLYNMAMDWLLDQIVTIVLEERGKAAAGGARSMVSG